MLQSITAAVTSIIDYDGNGDKFGNDDDSDNPSKEQEIVRTFFEPSIESLTGFHK